MGFLASLLAIGFLFDGLRLFVVATPQICVALDPLERWRFCFLFSFWIYVPSRLRAGALCCWRAFASVGIIIFFSVLLLLLFCFCYRKCGWVVGLFPAWFVLVCSNILIMVYRS